MLEHVPDPASIVAACAQLAKPGGDCSCSRRSTATRSRTRSRSSAPSTCCDLLPRGTHDWAQLHAAGRARRAMRAARGLDLDADDRHDLQPADPASTASSPTRRVNYLAAFRRAVRMDDAAPRGSMSTRSCSTSTARSPIRRAISRWRSTACARIAACRRCRSRRCAATRRPARAACCMRGMGVTPERRRLSRRCATRSSRTTSAALRDTTRLFDGVDALLDDARGARTRVGHRDQQGARASRSRSSPR